MPFKSEAQRRAMYAALRGHSTAGIPRDVARKFVKESHGHHGKLPERVRKKHHRKKYHA